jgi:hypothetical protein
MTKRPAMVVLALAVGIAPALGQPLNSVVVPAGASIVVPPRGQSLPAPVPAAPIVMAPAAAPASAALPGVAAPASTMGLGAGLAVVLPLAAAALLGSGLPGSGGSTSAPATTR